MDTTAHIIVAFLFFIAFLSNFLPIIPGTLVAFGAILSYKFISPNGEIISYSFLLWNLGIVAFAQIADLLFTWLGAKAFGASFKGALGALIGGIVGMIFFSIPGMILGPIIGAILFELLNDRTKREAIKAGIGTIVGGILAFMIKMALTVIMIAWFYTFIG